MRFERASGILLHPTSLPGAYGIGEMGKGAYRWLDFLASSGSQLWQVLPLGPTGYGDSPYQCFSAFAGNTYLISIDDLLDSNLLTPDDLADQPEFPSDRVDYGPLIQWKVSILTLAYRRFISSASAALRSEFEAFQAEEAHWLDDFTLFMAIKENHQGAPWVEWPSPMRDRNPDALKSFRDEHDTAVQRHAFWQFIFFRQWRALQTRAHELGITIIGDIPIFVAHDSSDVWANPNLFYLDKKGSPSVVAGVPPDYFSSTGQMWGNPLYRWENHAAEGYAWWLDRFRAVLKTVDIVRLDHFRGFAGYWEIPADSETAINGRWVPGPGTKFFLKLRGALGDLPIIAEDLGEITPDVIELRDRFDLPGMKVLVFAFDGDGDNEFLPHNYTPNYVVYTGTHDNDTALGWYKRVDEEERKFARRYLHTDGSDISRDLIRAAWSSVGVFALAPMQDFLGLDNSARMNYPSQPSGNWTWRMPPDALSDSLIAELRELNTLYSRHLLNPQNPTPPL